MGNGKEEGWDPGHWEGKGSGKIGSLKTREGQGWWIEMGCQEPERRVKDEHYGWGQGTIEGRLEADVDGDGSWAGRKRRRNRTRWEREGPGEAAQA